MKTLLFALLISSLSSALADSSPVFRLDADHSDRIYREGEVATFSLTVLTAFNGPDGAQEVVARGLVDGTTAGAVQGDPTNFSFASSPFTEYQIGPNVFTGKVFIRSKTQADHARDAIAQATSERDQWIAAKESTSDPLAKDYDETQIRQLDRIIDSFEKNLETMLTPVGTQTLDFTVRPSDRNITLARTGQPQTIPVASQIASPSGTPLSIIGLTQPSRGTVSLNPDGTVAYTPGASLFRVYQADLAPGGTQPNGDLAPFSSNVAPGSSVIGLTSAATNLFPLNTTGITDGYAYDPVRGTIDMVTPTYNMQQPSANVSLDTLSGSGRFISFETAATNMLPSNMNTGGFNQIYVFDRVTRSLSLVTVGTNGQPANQTNSFGELSVDGSVISFDSLATNLTSKNTFGHNQAYVRDLITGETKLASVDMSGNAGEDGNSSFGDVSGIKTSRSKSNRRSLDGRFVSYTSTASNLAPGLTPGVYNVLIHDFQTGKNIVASVDQNGNASTTANSVNGDLSPDGTKVAFFSVAPLVAGASGSSYQVYLRNLSTSTTTRAISGLDSSLNRDVELNGPLSWFAQTPDFRYFVFSTAATNVLTGIGDGSTYHCYLEDTTTSEVIPLDVMPDGSEMLSVATPNQGLSPGCQSVLISADATYALITEQSANGISGNTGANINAFVVTKTDQFTYTATDAQGNVLTGTVTLTEPLTGTTRAAAKKRPQ